MKRIVGVIAVAAVVLVIGGVAFAQMGGGWGPGSGCLYGAGYTGTNGTVNVEKLKKFQKDSLGLRDELITKRAELANEYAKPTPDATRIADLRKQMIDTQAKIQKVAEINGLPAWGQGYGRGGMGRGGRGRGMMSGSGPNGCPQWQ